MKKLMTYITLCLSVISCSNLDECVHQTELKLAVDASDEVKIAQLLDEGSEINDPIGCDNFLSLESAVMNNDMDLFKFLIDHGAVANYRVYIAAGKSQNPEFNKILESSSCSLRSPKVQCKK